MASMQDCSIGYAQESVYGTSVTPTRWPEFLTETLDYRKNIKSGAGLRVGSRVNRSSRRMVASADAGGDITLEVPTKGLGTLLQALLGSGTSTVVSGTTYQQVFTLADIPPSLTVQKGLVRADGTVDAYTFLGAMCDNFELQFDNIDVLKLKATLDCKDVTTGTAYAAPSYVAGASLFTFASATIQTGVLTSPTTTALGSGGTAVANVRSGSVAVDQKLTKDRYNFGGGGRKAKPTAGIRAITGKLEAEYSDVVFRDAVMSDTPMSLIVTYSASALSTGLETFQVIVPEIKFDSELPKSNAGDMITQSLNFVGLDNVTAAQPIWIVVRTADSAL